MFSKGKLHRTCGCIGSEKLHININEGVIIILEALSTLSSNDISSAQDTAMIPIQ